MNGRITGLLYRLTVAQTFVNAHAEPLEATYIFPLPARAGVTRFRLQVGERVIEGVLKERGAARDDYDQALRQGHRAAIAEEERPEVFTIRAGNIPPGEAVGVELELELAGPLAFADGEATFRFPLVVAPRYIPGIALDGASVGSGVAPDTDAVPDASRISPPVLLPGQPNPVHLSFRLELDPAGLPLRNLRASLLTLAPSATPPATLRPRDVVVVLDRSGSMGGGAADRHPDRTGSFRPDPVRRSDRGARAQRRPAGCRQQPPPVSDGGVPGAGRSARRHRDRPRVEPGAPLRPSPTGSEFCCS